MPNKITDVATQFVDLILKHKQWNEVKTLPTNEAQILFNIVSAAGFDPKKIMPGKLVGYYLDSDGSKTDETYPINSLCPFKVVRKEDGDDHDHYFATGWLDCALQRVIYGSPPRLQKEDRENLIKAMTKEIERSVPLTPIQLTPEGDLLCENPPSKDIDSEYFVDHTRDNHQLSLYVGSNIGVHKFCGYRIERMRATETHDAIVCQECHLRVLFPKNNKTYGELRQALASKFAQVPA